jgi:protocatechuate 3,4-dioxygenase beta subunit
MAHLRKIFLIIFLASIFFYSFKASADICPPTQNDVEGPYYLPDAPFRTNVAAPDEPGKRVIIKGTVFETNCKTPLKDALVEVWQTDAGGRYYYQEDGYRLRGQLKADKNGSYEFITIKPGRYRIGSGYRPAHIHIKVSHTGYRTLVTQLYFKEDPYLWPKDACGSGCKSDDPKRIIELQTKKSRLLEGRFIIFLEKQ